MRRIGTMERPPRLADSFFSKARDTEPSERPSGRSRWPVDPRCAQGSGVDPGEYGSSSSHRNRFAVCHARDQASRGTHGYRIRPDNFPQPAREHVASRECRHLPQSAGTAYTTEEHVYQLPAFLRERKAEYICTEGILICGRSQHVCPRAPSPAEISPTSSLRMRDPSPRRPETCWQALRKYQVSFYSGEISQRVIYVVYYAVPPDSEQGYVYLPGKSEEWWVST